MQYQETPSIRHFPMDRLLTFVLTAFIGATLSLGYAIPALGQTALPMNGPSLAALRKANTYGATIFHVQSPGPDFVNQMRTAIPKDYPGMDQGIRTGLANIQRDLPYLSGYFANKNRDQLASFVATYRAKITDPKDPLEQQVRLAEVMAFIALTAYRQHQNGDSATSAFQRQQMETLKNKQLQGAARSYSPTCVPGNTDASCHP